MTTSERQRFAMWLQTKLQPLRWEFSLDETGGLLVTIGDDLDGVPQHIVLQMLFAFELEFTHVLSAQVH